MRGRMLWVWLSLISGLFYLAACSLGRTMQSTAAPTQVGNHSVSLIRHQGELFSTAGQCNTCHTNLSDQTGLDVSIDNAWRSSMMANAARDPYYRASVRSEAGQHADYAEVIEDKCATCHLPMAHTTAILRQEPTRMLPPDGFLNPEHPYYPLAWDSVSCTHCHQVDPSNFGHPDSFSGGFTLDGSTPTGDRLAFGRWVPAKDDAELMQQASGFVPSQAAHLSDSEFCATCHNLFTIYFETDGSIGAEMFPEQTPHLEWLHSQYAAGTSCQDCHMPVAQGQVAVANTGSPPRSPFLQHTFVGGNIFMVNLLSSFPEAFTVTARPADFQSTADRTLDQLQNRTSSLAVRGSQDGEKLDVSIGVTVQTGHKFPTSFPSRRTWLHVQVVDAQGTLIFESGAWQPDGSIVGNDNDADPEKFEPHYDRITAPDQVQIYEPIISSPTGSVTTNLLEAKAYLKDNRLLPPGFDKATAGREIAVCGRALEDSDFTAGGDQVDYQIDLAGSQGPYTVTVELLYQTIGYRWAENLRGDRTPESEEFFRHYDQIENRPVSIVRAERVID